MRSTPRMCRGRRPRRPDIYHYLIQNSTQNIFLRNLRLFSPSPCPLPAGEGNIPSGTASLRSTPRYEVLTFRLPSFNIIFNIRSLLQPILFPCRGRRPRRPVYLHSTLSSINEVCPILFHFPCRGRHPCEAHRICRGRRPRRPIYLH